MNGRRPIARVPRRIHLHLHPSHPIHPLHPIHPIHRIHRIHALHPPPFASSVCDIETLVSAFRSRSSGVPTTTVRQLLRTHHDVFTGSTAVTWLCEYLGVTRGAALEVLALLRARFVLAHPTSPSRPAADDDTLYTLLPRVSRTRLALSDGAVRALWDDMRAPGGVEVADRTYRLRTYPLCFVGSQAVDWLVRATQASRKQALRIGRRMVELGLIAHVAGEHQLKDAFLFYRFAPHPQALIRNMLAGLGYGDVHLALLHPWTGVVREGDASLHFQATAAVDWLVENQEALPTSSPISRPKAVQILQWFLEAGYIEYVAHLPSDLDPDLSDHLYDEPEPEPQVGEVEEQGGPSGLLQLPPPSSPQEEQHVDDDASSINSSIVRPGSDAGSPKKEGMLPGPSAFVDTDGAVYAPAPALHILTIDQLEDVWDAMQAPESGVRVETRTTSESPMAPQESCFIGSEAVAFVASYLESSRTRAQRVCQWLLDGALIIACQGTPSSTAHLFQNAYTFYVFQTPSNSPSIPVPVSLPVETATPDLDIDFTSLSPTLRDVGVSRNARLAHLVDDGGRESLEGNVFITDNEL